MATRKQIEQAAEAVGVFVAYYNPGDNPSWKFAKVDRSYFALSGPDVLGNVHGPASAAMLWLDGYAAGRNHALAEAFVVSVEEGRDSARRESARRRRGF